MTRKRKRLLVVLLGLGMLGIASALILFAFNDNLVFFMSPSDLATKGSPETRRLRLGGLVEAGSVARQADGRTIDFRVTDGSSAVPVVFGGVLPDLFREGQGVVVEGALGKNGIFQAARGLGEHRARHMQ